MDFTTGRFKLDASFDPQMCLVLSFVSFLPSHVVFMSSLFLCPLAQLSVGLRFSVQRLEDAEPMISFELQIHR